MNDKGAAELRVGARWHGAFPKSYWEHFSLLELPLDKMSTLRRKTIATWLGEPTIGRTLVIPYEANLIGGDIAQDNIAMLIETSKLAQDSVILLHTSPAFRPSRKNVATLQTNLNRLVELGLEVAWWSDGLWSFEDRAEIVSEASCRLVVDPMDEDLDEVETHVPYYLRVRGRRGFQNQFSDHDFHTLATRSAALGPYLSFGLTGFWSDALRFNAFRFQDDDFWM